MRWNKADLSVKIDWRDSSEVWIIAAEAWRDSWEGRG